MFYGQHILLCTYKQAVWTKIGQKIDFKSIKWVLENTIGTESDCWVHTTYQVGSILTSKKKILSLTFGQAAAAATQSGSATVRRGVAQ